MQPLHSTLLLALGIAAALPAAAQPASYDEPYFLPGEGVYHVGLSSATLQPALTEPTLVTAAYKARFRLFNTDMASIKAGTQTYNLAKYISDDGTELNLVPFMGVGNAYDLTLRNLDGGVYQLGDNAPAKAWYNTRLLAAQPDWKGNHSLPLAVYDQWDCPITYAKDPALGPGGYDAVSVDFGNPQEGLVVTAIDFPVVCGPQTDQAAELTVTLNIYNNARTEIIDNYTATVRIDRLPEVALPAGIELPEGQCVRRLNISMGKTPVVISTPFEMVVTGFSGDGADVWLARSVDPTGIYPSHTTYGDWFGEAAPIPAGAQANEDAVVNVEGYFNYLGTWGWYDGKWERGEVVSTADLVQIYYDPSEPDWPGDYFMGEAAFPLECTFGAQDITIYDMPQWINAISYDVSQWEEYGCVQITLSADALPSDLSGRNGKVVLATQELASFYTIYVRQGAAWFDMGEAEGIAPPLAPLPAAAPSGLIDLSGRPLAAPRRGQPYLRQGHLTIDL